MENTLPDDELHAIWLRAKANQPQADLEAATLAVAMQDHPEYHAIFDRLNDPRPGDREVDGVRPTAHISFHAMIETQLANDVPPEVNRALKALLARGAERHAAIHALAYELLMEIQKSLANDQLFNTAGYQRRLHKIIAKSR